VLALYKADTVIIILSNVTCSRHGIAEKLFILRCIPITHHIRMYMVFMVFKCHFQQYFSYIVVVSFIGGGNRRTCSRHGIAEKLFILRCIPITHHIRMYMVYMFHDYVLLQSWIYHYLCNRCLSPLMCWIFIELAHF
jgi:hypothetical protein